MVGDYTEGGRGHRVLARLAKGDSTFPAPDKDLCPDHAAEWKARRP